jgi:5S rRNA maturation endonuclease (ribonuclease M5)
MSQDSLVERLEELEDLLDDLRVANELAPVLVEGEKDVAALRELGLEGEIVRVKGPGTVFVVCEELARHHRACILMVDWDRGGGHLARLLLDALRANSVRCDETFRRAFARATKKEVVHVEGLARYLGNLRLAARKHPSRGANP